MDCSFKSTEKEISWAQRCDRLGVNFDCPTTQSLDAPLDTRHIEPNSMLKMIAVQLKELKEIQLNLAADPMSLATVPSVTFTTMLPVTAPSAIVLPLTAPSAIVLPLTAPSAIVLPVTALSATMLPVTAPPAQFHIPTRSTTIEILNW